MSPSLQSYNLLLEVFYWGLKWGLITKAEVVKWADEIIIAEAEPDYFFIELSLSKDIIASIGLVRNQMNLDNEPVVCRVLLGIIYYKLSNNVIELQKAAIIMDKIALHNTLTSYERGSLYQFSDEEQEAFRQEHFETLRIEILEYLSDYKSFTLDNYNTWPSINEQIETLLLNITQQIIENQEAYTNGQNYTNSIHQFSIKLALYLLILTAEIVIIAKPDLNYKFNKDLYTISLLIFAIAMCYPIVWMIYRALAKLFRI